MLELAGRGHQVTEVTPFIESKVVPNYTQIELKIDFASGTGGHGKCKRAACSKTYLFKFLVILSSSLTVVLLCCR